MKIETLAIHAAHEPDPVTGGVAPSIRLSTTFARGDDGELPGSYSYSRGANPNRTALELAVAALEGGEAAFAYASGIAAIAAVFQALSAGDHVIMPDDIYHGTRALAGEMAAWGLEASYIPVQDPAAIRQHIRSNTRLIFIETPSNPMLQITDIAAVVALAAETGLRVAVDNTWATPVLQRPLALGADYSVHSSTKYFGGHSDVLGGVLVCRAVDGVSEKIAVQQWTMGAVPSPFDCWLVRRGLMTLPLRIRSHSDHAAEIARFLEGHDRVSTVYYPGLSGHPGYETAMRQMASGGGMLSFRVRDGEAAAERCMARLRLFTRATSLGAVESLAEHRYKVEGPDTQTPRDLIRLSIGLEHPEDLMADLAQALVG